MFEHILVPLDGSDLAQRILGPLRRLVSGDEPARVTLLRVLQQGEDADAARADLDRLVGLLSTSGLAADAEFREGRDPSEAILAAEKELKPGLIAMSTHGRTGLTRLVRGSVAERVLRRCTHPLLLCNPKVLHGLDGPRDGFTRLLVPLDGSDLAAAVLDGASTLAKAYDAEVILFKVENFATDGGRDTLRDLAEVRESLAPARDRLIAAGVREVNVDAAVGNDIAEIIAAVDRHGIDLLAMTTHGRSGASRLWFGSVAEAIVREAPCPLFVLRVSGGD